MNGTEAMKLYKKLLKCNWCPDELFDDLTGSTWWPYTDLTTDDEREKSLYEMFNRYLTLLYDLTEKEVANFERPNVADMIWLIKIQLDKELHKVSQHIYVVEDDE